MWSAGKLLTRLLRLILPAMALAAGFAATSAKAQVCSASMPALTFGSIDVLPGVDIDYSSTLTVSCSGIPVGFRVRACIALYDGDVAPFDATWRQMASGANLLRFTIYRNAAFSQRWGGTAAQQVGITVNRNTGFATRAIRARIQSGQQSASVGSYLNNMDGLMTYVLYSTSATAPGCASVTSNPTPLGFPVTATVAANCSVSATNMNFGTTGVIAANVDATSTVTVTCTTNAPYHVRLNGGLTGATNPAARKMANGAEQITYGLYRDMSRSLPWGATDGVNTAAGTGTSSGFGHIVYGRIPPQTTPSPGVYSDTIVVEVAF